MVEQLSQAHADFERQMEAHEARVLDAQIKRVTEIEHESDRLRRSLSEDRLGPLPDTGGPRSTMQLSRRSTRRGTRPLSATLPNQESPATHVSTLVVPSSLSSHCLETAPHTSTVMSSGFFGFFFKRFISFIAKKSIFPKKNSKTAKKYSKNL